MLILDTDVLTIVQRGKGPEFERLAQPLSAAGGAGALRGAAALMLESSPCDDALMA